MQRQAKSSKMTKKSTSQTIKKQHTQQKRKLTTQTKKPSQYSAPIKSTQVLTTMSMTSTPITTSMASFSSSKPVKKTFKSSLPLSPHTSPFNKNHNTPTLSPFTTSQRNLFIQTHTTPNPRSLKFHPGKVVLGEREDGTPNSVFFDQSSRANARRQCNLAYTLLLLDGVMNVMLGADFVTVTTIDDNTDWMLLKPMVYEAISEAYATDEPILKNASEVGPSRELPMIDGDEEAVSLIKEIIDLRIRPTVMDDGGDVEFIHFDKDRVVWLLMKGSCSGCPSSGATLKHGIQNMIMHYVPEVKSVEEWKDEAELVSDEVFQRLEQKLASKNNEKH